MASLALRWIGDVAFPLRQSDGALLPSRARWMLHLSLAATLLVGLWGVSRLSGLDLALRSPFPALHRVWLPGIGASIYASAWLGFGLWTAMRRREDVSERFEMDAAWSRVIADLRTLGISPAHAPGYLVLGSPSADLDAWLAELGASKAVTRDGSPIEVYADIGTFFLVAPEIERTPGQLHRLCELVSNEREGGLPLQGVILTAPFAALQSDARFDATARGFQAALGGIRAATGQEVPVYVAITGLSSLPGAPENCRSWFQLFPPSPDLDPAEIRSMYEEGIDWLCTGQIAQEARSGFGSDVAENIRRYRWLSAVETARPKLLKLLIEATQDGTGEPGLVAGCILLPDKNAVTPAEEMTRLWRGLDENQHAAAWTAERLATHAEGVRKSRVSLAIGVASALFTLAALGTLLLLRQ